MKRFLEPWQGKMTPREVFNNQMNYKSFDRSFNKEFGWWDENFEQWDIFRDNGIKNNVDGEIAFGFDKIDVLWSKGWLEPYYEKKVIEERGDLCIIINEDGVMAEVHKDALMSSIPHYIKPSVVTPDDWKRVKEERLVLDDPARIIDVELLKTQHLPDEGRDYPLGVDTGSMIGRVRDMLTFEGLCYAIYDYPEMVEDMVETACCLVEKSLDQLLPHFKFDYASGWEDVAFKNGPMFSPDFFKEVLAPRYKRIKKKLEQYGVKVWYFDCDGDIKPLIPCMLDCGINTLFPFEVNSAGDVRNVLNEYGGELRVMGGVDKIVLARGKEDIKKYLEGIEPYVAKGGFIPHCDHRCPPDVSPENYFYYLDLKRKMFGGY